MMRTSQIPARFLSFAVGLLSLGSETLWIRTYSFQNESIAKAFPFILGIYLLGIAFGQLLAREPAGTKAVFPKYWVCRCCWVQARSSWGRPSSRQA
jgi:hypothetical protein